jgi:hypothetical protein
MPRCLVLVCLLVAGCMGAAPSASSCRRTENCPPAFFCQANRCVDQFALGARCSDADQCLSGFCADGVCCQTACNSTCFSCNTASAGTCVAAAVGEDPRMDCPTDPPASCLRSGGCNGKGGCRLYPAGAVCRAAGCSNAAESAMSTCDGAGLCVPMVTKECEPFGCNGQVCGKTCATNTDCKTGFACSDGACVFTGGLLAHWKLDETSGPLVMDSSGNGFNATLPPDATAPTPSKLVPPVKFTDAGSFAFSLAMRQAIQLPTLPPMLRPANNITVTAWYRALVVDTNTQTGAASGSEIVSAGNHYLLRVRATQVEFSKRSTSPTGALTFAQCFAIVPNHLDGQWHHMAGQTSPAGLKLYFDGKQVCSSGAGEDIKYDQSDSLWIGRHGNGQEIWDFDGNIDDVRIYGRALSPDEIAWLASGGA